jgi:hypothetical protein
MRFRAKNRIMIQTKHSITKHKEEVRFCNKKAQANILRLWECLKTLAFLYHLAIIENSIYYRYNCTATVNISAAEAVSYYASHKTRSYLHMDILSRHLPIFFLLPKNVGIAVPLDFTIHPFYLCISGSLKLPT